MAWQIVEFFKDKSIAAVPKLWIKKYKKYFRCYWPKSNAESLRKKLIPPVFNKNDSNFYQCKILLNKETFNSFQEALAAEKKLVARTPLKKGKKTTSAKSSKENQQTTALFKGASGCLLVPVEKQLSGVEHPNKFNDGSDGIKESGKQPPHLNDDSVCIKNDSQPKNINDDSDVKKNIGRQLKKFDGSDSLNTTSVVDDGVIEYKQQTCLSTPSSDCNNKIGNFNEASECTSQLYFQGNFSNAINVVEFDQLPDNHDAKPHLIAECVINCPDKTESVFDGHTMDFEDLMNLEPAWNSEQLTNLEPSDPLNYQQRPMTVQQILSEPVFTESMIDLNDCSNRCFDGSDQLNTNKTNFGVENETDTLTSSGECGAQSDTLKMSDFKCWKKRIVDSYHFFNEMGAPKTETIIEASKTASPFSITRNGVEPHVCDNVPDDHHQPKLQTVVLPVIDGFAYAPKFIERPMSADRPVTVELSINVEQVFNDDHSFVTDTQIIDPINGVHSPNLEQSVYFEQSNCEQPINPEPFVISGPFVYQQPPMTFCKEVSNDQSIAEPVYSESMVSFGDYLNHPFNMADLMDLDFSLHDLFSTSKQSSDQVKNAENLETLLLTAGNSDLINGHVSEESFGALDKISETTTNDSDEKLVRGKMTADCGEQFRVTNFDGAGTTSLNKVSEFFANRGSDYSASVTTCVSKTNDDISAEVNEMNSVSDTGATDPQMLNQEPESSGAQGCDYDSDDSVVGQVKQRNGRSEYRIHNLGSNNYRDSKGYLYTKNNCRKSNLYLRCKNSVKHQCLARVTVRDNNYEEAVMTIVHSHPPDKQIFDNQIFDKKLEENIDRDPFQTPRQVYLATKEQLKDTIDLTNIHSLKKKEGFIYRRQRKYIPPLPSTVEAFEKFIADEKYRQFFTCDQRNLPYYRGVWTSKKGERNLAFISENILKLVNQMNHIALFMDGTYKALPHHIPFRQLYVICVAYENQCYPLAYIFMEKKTFTSYDTIFENLKLMMPSVEVAKLMTDYEAATRKALRKHYPNARLAGCFFHYVQAIVKSTKRFGLRRDERFTDAIQKICHLALLPNDFVLKGFESIDVALKDLGSKRWERFRSYWLKQWAPANISVYGLVDRTNNFSESNNHSLNSYLLKQHPNIWTLIKNLKLMEMDRTDQFRKAVKGEMYDKRESADVKAFNAKVEKATKLFDEDQDVGRFLERVTYGQNVDLFVKHQVNIMDDDEDIDDEGDEEVVPNNYVRDSDFRKNHPREVVLRKNGKP